MKTPNAPIASVWVLLVASLIAAAGAVAQEAGRDAATVPHYPSGTGKLFIPASSQPHKSAPGQKLLAHTNVEIYHPAGFQPDEAPPYGGYFHETPASLACHYGLVTTSAAPACNPNTTTVNPTGGSNSIAIVDAYDDPNAASDLATFSTQFGIALSKSQFEVVYANTAASSCPVNLGDKVPTDPTGGWELEESLDIEWSHAMAPAAKIYLVEACSNAFSDLQQAILVANNLVRCGHSELNSSTGALGSCPAGSTGKGEISMSWGGSEFSGEKTANGCTTFNDSCFLTPGIVYFASTGDTPGVEYPSASPNVVAAGGTTNRRNPTTGNEEIEYAWTLAGAGESAYEARPSYQSSVSGTVGTQRGVPDLSFDANPYTGVWFYDSYPVDGYEYYDWGIVGGTSVAAPSLAGIVNRAGSFAASSNAELTSIYADKALTADYTDITAAYCGPYQGLATGTGWDLCTGVGVVKGYAGK